MHPALMLGKHVSRYLDLDRIGGESSDAPDNSPVGPFSPSDFLLPCMEVSCLSRVTYVGAARGTRTPLLCLEGRYITINACAAYGPTGETIHLGAPALSAQSIPLVEWS